jgi:hypothetical protein
VYSACSLSDFYGMMHLALPSKQTCSISIVICIDKSFATIGNSAQQVIAILMCFSADDCDACGNVNKANEMGQR